VSIYYRGNEAVTFESMIFRIEIVAKVAASFLISTDINVIPKWNHSRGLSRRNGEMRDPSSPPGILSN
jgi:hypothetical protein